MHSFGFGVKMWAQALQKALDILFASPENHSPGNEGLKDGIKAPVSKLQLQCWQGWNFPVSKEKHPTFKCLVSLAPALLLAGSSELFPLLGAIWDPEFCLLALSHAGVYKFSAFFPNPSFLWSLFASGVSAKCHLPVDPARSCHMDLGNYNVTCEQPWCLPWIYSLPRS